MLPKALAVADTAPTMSSSGPKVADRKPIRKVPVINRNMKNRKKLCTLSTTGSGTRLAPKRVGNTARG